MEDKLKDAQSVLWWFTSPYRNSPPLCQVTGNTSARLLGRMCSRLAMACSVSRSAHWEAMVFNYASHLLSNYPERRGEGSLKRCSPLADKTECYLFGVI